MTAIEGQLCDIQNADAKELGEVVDMLKDLAEYCYYSSITEAMEKNSDTDNQMYMNKYLSDGKYYDDLWRDPKPMYYKMPRYPRRMYYDNMMYDDSMIYPDEWNRYYSGGRSSGSNSGSGTNSRSGSSTNYYTNYDRNIRDVREGRSGITRRNYMETKNKVSKEQKMQEFEAYMHDLTDDIIEMIDDMEPHEKDIIRGKMNDLANKIV